MQQKTISFHGINTAIDDINVPDGTLATCHNLELSDGALRSASLSTDAINVPVDEELLCIHVTTAYRNLILYKPAADEEGFGRLLWRSEEDTTQTGLIIDGTDTPLIRRTSLFNINFLGNVLTLLTADGIKYAINRGTSYEYLGPIPHIDARLYVKGSREQAYDNSELFDLNNIDLVKQHFLIAYNNAVSTSFARPFLARVALELFDGTTFVSHTAPVLIIPNDSFGAFYCQSSRERTYTDFFYISGKLYFQIENYKEIVKFRDIIRSVVVAITYPYDFHNDNSSINNVDSDTATAHYSYGYVGEESTILSVRNCSVNNTAPFTYFVAFRNASFSDYVKNACDFRIVHRALIDYSTGSIGGEIPCTDNFFQNLELQDKLPDDYDSLSTICARASLVYNKRLNLYNITQRPFSGYSPFNSSCYTSWGNVRNFKFIVIAEKNNTVQYYVSPSECPAFLFLSFLYFPIKGAKKFVIQGDFETGGTWPTYEYTTFHSKEFELQSSPYLNGYIYAPDDDLESFHVGNSFFSTTYGQNGAAHDIKELLTIEGPYEFTPTDNTTYLDNELWISEVSNPFTFPLQGRNVIGTGDITAIASVSTALSQGQFGQFPLMALCTDGNYALNISSDGLISSVVPMQRDVCTSASSVTTIDGAIIFASRRGLMIADGSNIQCLSDVLYGSEQLNMFDNAMIAFDYTQQRLIIFGIEHTDSDAATSLSMVYSLRNGTWSFMNTPVIESVYNLYPASYIRFRGESKLRYLSGVRFDTGTDTLSVSFTTRPIKLDSVGLKRLRAFRLLVSQCGAHPYDEPMATITIHASVDGINYYKLGTTTRHEQNGLRFPMYRYFKVEVKAHLRPAERIMGMQFNVDYDTNTNLK